MQDVSGVETGQYGAGGRSRATVISGRSRDPTRQVRHRATTCRAPIIYKQTFSYHIYTDRRSYNLKHRRNSTKHIQIQHFYSNRTRTVRHPERSTARSFQHGRAGTGTAREPETIPHPEEPSAYGSRTGYSTGNVGDGGNVLKLQRRHFNHTENFSV